MKNEHHTCKASCSAVVDDPTAACQATCLLLFAKSEFSGYNMPGIFIQPAAEFQALNIFRIILSFLK
jgi:hypothetical protein